MKIFATKARHYKAQRNTKVFFFFFAVLRVLRGYFYNNGVME